VYYLILFILLYFGDVICGGVRELKIKRKSGEEEKKVILLFQKKIDIAKSV
jgi:hypothetical protein